MCCVLQLLRESLFVEARNPVEAIVCGLCSEAFCGIPVLCFCLTLRAHTRILTYAEAEAKKDRKDKKGKPAGKSSKGSKAGSHAGSVASKARSKK